MNTETAMVIGCAGFLCLGLYLGSAGSAFRKATQVGPAPSPRGFSYADLVLSSSPPTPSYPDDALMRANEAYLSLSDEEALDHLHMMRQMGSPIVRDELLPPAALDFHVTLRVEADKPISEARSRMLARLVMNALDDAQPIPHGGSTVVSEPADDAPPPPPSPRPAPPSNVRVRALDL